MNHYYWLLGFLFSSLSSCVWAFDQNKASDSILFNKNFWSFSSDIRSGWLQYDYSNPVGDRYDPKVNKGHQDSEGFYLVPKFSFVTEEINGVTAKITAAAVTDFGLNSHEKETRNFVFNIEEPKSYAILQEAYLKYNFLGNELLIGREEVTTPMVEADDYYMLANSFEVAYYRNTQLKNTIITLGYFHKMAGVWDSGAFDSEEAPDGGTDFYSMAQASFVDSRDKENAKNKGIVFSAYQYKSHVHDLQFWNYYADELYNIFFTQYDYYSHTKNINYNIGAQFINFKEVGELADNDFSEIDYNVYSLRFNGNFGNGVDFSTGASKFSDGKGQGETLGAWGGYPYFANGMIFHFFEAGSLQNASSYKVQLGYNFAPSDTDTLWFGVRHTYFDLDPNYSMNKTGEGQENMKMYGIRLNYQGKSGHYLTITYEYVDLDKEPSISAMRLIGGIKF